MQQSGQGAIEYLLIIAAAILVVAIVILAVTGALSGGQGQTDYSQYTQKDALTQLEIQQELAKKNTPLSEVGEIPTIGTWEDNQTYFLTNHLSDASYGFMLLGSADENITINCLGYSLESQDLRVTYSLILRGGTGTTIKNCVFVGQDYGPVALNVEDYVIENVTSVGNNIGVYLYNSKATIKNSTFCGNTTNDIYCYGSTEITVENSKADSYPGCNIVSGSFDPCP